MRKEFKVKCKNCGKEFKVFEEESKFPIKGDKYFCCRSCSNVRHHTKEQKEKIKNSLLNKPENIKKRQEKLLYKETHTYYCGSKELDEKNPDISCRQSPKYFNKLIPFGLDITKLYTEDFIQEHSKVKQLLYKEYIENCLSPRDIYNKYNCKEYFNNSETLLHLFKDWKFHIRSWSSATVNEYKQGKHNNFGKWHTTWNNKEVYLRSSYELDYANELDKKQIDYEVEFNHIKYWDSQDKKYRCAIPNFYIPKDNMIVEIKSSWTLDKQNMKDKMKAYLDLGYKFKLICDHKELEI